MARKDFTLTSKILMSLLMAGDMLFVPPKEASKRSYKGEFFGDFSRSKSTIYHLVKKGWIKIIDKDNQRFIKLTKHGQLEALLAKARLKTIPKSWDGKWRMIIFDIPEDSHDKRDFLRYLLKKNNFVKLQASVFINPYPLSREAISYLKESGLISFIRIIKVEEMDDDSDLRKRFNLSK